MSLEKAWTRIKGALASQTNEILGYHWPSITELRAEADAYSRDMTYWDDDAGRVAAEAWLAGFQRACEITQQAIAAVPESVPPPEGSSRD